MESGRKPHVAPEKGNGNPHCSSVGKSGREAHFLNEGPAIVLQLWVARGGAGSAARAHSYTNISKWTCFPLSPLVSTSVPHNACCDPEESAIVPMHLGVKGVTGSGKGAFLPSLLHPFYPADNPPSAASGLSDPALHSWNVAGWCSPHLPPDLLMPFNLLEGEHCPTKQSCLFCVSKCRLWLGKMNMFIYSKRIQTSK